VAAASIEEVFGGDFNDVFDGSGLTGGIDFVRLRGDGGDDTLIGGEGDDKLYGGDHQDLLQGNDGNDFLVGGNGNDTLEGGAGIDKLVGGQGNDNLSGGADNDIIIAATGVDPEGADIIDGGAGDDQIFADASDTVSGGDGRDLLVARGATGLNVDVAAASIEETRGSAFDDVFDGSGFLNGIDFVRLRGDGGNDTLIGGAGEDKLYGGADMDLLQGNGGADFLLGQEGNDTIEGGGGIDIIIGGLGMDTLTGGADADSFWSTDFASAADIDTITDYSFIDGDSVQGVSFTFDGTDSTVFDGLAGSGNAMFVLANYDANSGINLFA